MRGSSVITGLALLAAWEFALTGASTWAAGAVQHGFTLGAGAYVGLSLVVLARWTKGYIGQV